jgi:hypothetical protein
VFVDADPWELAILEGLAMELEDKVLRKSGVAARPRADAA